MVVVVKKGASVVVDVRKTSVRGVERVVVVVVGVVVVVVVVEGLGLLGSQTALNVIGGIANGQSIL